MADTPRYTGVTYNEDYFRQPNESMYDFMVRLAKARSTGILGGGGMLDTPAAAVATETVPTQTAPLQAANLGVVQANTGSGSSDTQKRVSSGQPLLDKNGNPILDGSGNPVMGTVVVNEPAKQTTYRDAVNIAGGNSLMPSDVLGKAGPLGTIVGLGFDYLAERDAISKAAEYLGVTEDDVATMAALDDTSAVKAAIENGMLGFKPNTDASTGMKIAKAVMNPMAAAKNFAKDTLFGTKDIFDYGMEDQLNAAILQEAANKAGMFSGVMKGMANPMSNILDRNPITGAGTAMINGQKVTYTPGLLSNVNDTSVVSSIFNPAVTAAAPQYMGFNFGALPVSDAAEQALSRALATGADKAAGTSSGGTYDYFGGDTSGGWTASDYSDFDAAIAADNANRSSSSSSSSSSGGSYTGGGSSYGANPSSTVSGGSGRTDGGYGW